MEEKEVINEIIKAIFPNPKDTEFPYWNTPPILSLMDGQK